MIEVYKFCRLIGDGYFSMWTPEHDWICQYAIGATTHARMGMLGAYDSYEKALGWGPVNTSNSVLFRATCGVTYPMQLISHSTNDNASYWLSERWRKPRPEGVNYPDDGAVWCDTITLIEQVRKFA